MPKSQSDKWATPKDLYDSLDAEFHFNHDPCPISWKEGDPDGLQTEWGTSTFCNPPYSAVARWIAKAHAEWKKGKTVVLLINAITDTKAFHEYIYNQADIRFLKGRVKFVCADNPDAPLRPNVKPSMVCIFRAP